MEQLLLDTLNDALLDNFDGFQTIYNVTDEGVNFEEPKPKKEEQVEKKGQVISVKKEQLEEIIERNFICPISWKYYFSPVVASDGHVYEETEIKRNFRYNHKSPLTRETLDGNFKKIPLINQLIDEIMEIFPDIKERSYIESTDYEENKDIIFTLLKDKNIEGAKRFKNFILEDTFNDNYNYTTLINLVLDIGDNKLLDYVLENCKSLSENNTIIFDLIRNSRDKTVFDKLKKIGMRFDVKYDAYTPIQYACMYSTPTVIKYLIDNGADIKENYNSPYGSYNCFELALKKNNNQTTVKYIMDKWVELTDSTSVSLIRMGVKSNSKVFAEILTKYEKISEEDSNIVFEIFSNGHTFEIFKMFLDRAPNLDVVDGHGRNVLNYSFQLRDPKFSRLLLDIWDPEKLRVEDSNGWTPFHHACLYSDAENIMFLLFNGADLTKTVTYKSEKQYGPVELVQLNQKLKESDMEDIINMMVQML